MPLLSHDFDKQTCPTGLLVNPGHQSIKDSASIRFVHVNDGNLDSQLRERFAAFEPIWKLRNKLYHVKLVNAIFEIEGEMNFSEVRCSKELLSVPSWLPDLGLGVVWTAPNPMNNGT